MLLFSFLLGFSAPLGAQRDEEPETVILSSSEGSIRVDGRRGRLPWVESSFGPLVALGPMVNVLGGELTVGPLGQAHSLLVAGRQVVLGPLGREVTVDGEIHRISIRPWLEPERGFSSSASSGADSDARSSDSADGEGRAVERAGFGPSSDLFVPIDALAVVYPRALGFSFEFDRRRGVLNVVRTRQRRLDVEVDRVHDLGTTTFVVTFPSRPRYRVERYRGGVRLRLLSGLLEPRRRVRVNDPLVRWIEVRERSLDLGLAPSATASEPYLLGRPPRVQLVLDITRGRPRSTQRESSRAEAERGEFRIVLDPGHGGADDGVSTPWGEWEKDLVLQLARALQSRLEESLPVRVVLTRSGDSTVPLEERTALANQYEADLFLSLHVGSTHGSTLQAWILDPPPGSPETAGEGDARAPAESPEPAEAPGPAQVGAEQDELEKIAPEEGEQDEAAPSESVESAGIGAEEPEASNEDDMPDLGPDGEPGDDVEDEPEVEIPPLQQWERVQDLQLQRSEVVARLIQSRAGYTLDLENRQVLRAPVRILTGAAMPAVLIEFGYADGVAASILDREQGFEALDAIVGAVRVYLGAMAGVMPTSHRRPGS